MRILLAGIFLLAICSPAFTQQPGPVTEHFPWAHAAMTVLGVAVAIRLAFLAFERRVLNVADVPTFPRYMTCWPDYVLGVCMFMAFASGFFLLLVYAHDEVAALAALANKFGARLPEGIIDGLRDASAPYLVVIFCVGVVYLFCLTREADWNVLLMMRNAIQSWISIPRLAADIVAQLQFSLNVSADAAAQVAQSSPDVVEADFHKDRGTPDRIWAETCYMRWWLKHAQRAGKDATFFAEKSFGFEMLAAQFQQAATTVHGWKAGAAIEPTAVESLKALRKKFSRLLACYLIYRNGSRAALRAEAEKLGIELSPAAPENPMLYSIVYVLALMASVYLGVYASAVLYDWMTGAELIFTQDAQRARDWVAYSLANYGVAILAVLLVRYAIACLRVGVYQSHLLIYCWTFALAFITGPLGLALAVHTYGPQAYRDMALVQVFYNVVTWGVGPGLVAVYISYYLDRQIYDDLPEVNHSSSTIAWRLLNCIGFAAITVFIVLPRLMAMQAEAGAAWDTAKLRFVAAGTTFFVALGLALAAQFLLRKGTSAQEGNAAGETRPHAAAELKA
jgi:hypothetical protein